MSPKIFCLVIFLAAYLSFIFFPKKRTLFGILAALLLILFKVIFVKDALFFINWNVLGIFIGTLILADLFMESRVPAYLAELIAFKVKNTLWAILFICALTGFISAFVENVATVLIVAPVAFSLAKKLNINPTNIIIALAISSNLQGTATLVGDPPSMLLAGFAKLNFIDFFFYKGKLSIFFAVELGAIVSFFVLYLIFRKHKKKIDFIPTEKIVSFVPTYFLVGLIFVLAATSFFDKNFTFMAGLVCMIFAFFGLLWEKFFNKGSIIDGLKKLDWDTTFFLMSIFIIVGSLNSVGLIEDISRFLSKIVGKNIFLGYSIFVFSAVFFSGFVDNVPFLATMLPVAISVSEKLNTSPYLFLFGLLIGASLGGNITPIGASANIVACSLLEKEGYPVKFKDFVKIGLPFTLSAVLAAYLFIWFIWSR